MNVFDLPGPEFLLFYVLFGALVGVVAYAALRWTAGGEGTPPALLGNPFQIACLRGGPSEAARIAVVSLADRGLLQVQRSRLTRTSDKRPPRDLHPIEREVLTNCPAPYGEAAKRSEERRVGEE